MQEPNQPIMGIPLGKSLHELPTKPHDHEFRIRLRVWQGQGGKGAYRCAVDDQTLCDPLTRDLRLCATCAVMAIATPGINLYKFMILSRGHVVLFTCPSL